MSWSLFGANAMPEDPVSRVRRYRERAEECRALATQAPSPEFRAEYEKIAGCYDKLVEAELILARAQRQTKQD
jgi:hypothetical protein